MTNEEALKRFEGDLAFLRRTCTHSTTQMELYECAINALKYSISNGNSNPPQHLSVNKDNPSNVN